MVKNLSQPFHGHCGEIRTIRKSLDDGLELKDLQGATMKSINTKTGEIEKACDCCAVVMEKLDIKDVTKCH